MKRVGDISQIADLKEYTFNSGKSKGIRAIDVKTGGGLSFTILPDRGMDIAYTEYKGIPTSYISKVGIVSPYLFDSKGMGFFKNFFAGMLTTCGLTYMGAPCNDNGEELGAHGISNNILAEEVCSSKEWVDDNLILKVSGKIRESEVYGDNITLLRKYNINLGENKIVIKDEVENCGFVDSPLMLLYHFNFGYPFLDESCKIILPKFKIKPRDKNAEDGLEDYDKILKPTKNFKEQVFYYDVNTDKDGYYYVGLFNDSVNTGVYIKVNKNQLPYLVQWKQFGEGDYVMAFEPGTWIPEGRDKARERGELLYIKPFEKKIFELEIGFVDNEKELRELII